MLIANRKMNESAEHYELKQIAKYLLWAAGYTVIGTEVGGFNDWHTRNDGFPENCSYKNTIDTVGFKMTGWSNGVPKSISTWGMEAKASLSDYKNGFCTVSQYTTIIAPKGIIPVEIIPEKIGLIEVDLKNYFIKFNKAGNMEDSGIECTKSAKQRLAPRFANREERKMWAMRQLQRIAYRCSHENLFITPQIKLD